MKAFWLVFLSGAALAQTNAGSPVCSVNFNGTCPVTAFGAVGDGVTDNAKALQSALNYAAVNKCGVVVPAGTYAYSGVITVNGVALTGTGAQSILVPLDPANEAIILTGNGASISFLTLASHASARLTTNQSAMVWANGATNYKVQNVLIDGSASVGIFSVGSTGGTIVDNTVENSLADAISQIAGSSQIVVSGNRIINAGDDGISTVSYVQFPIVHDVAVQGNTVINNNHGRGITVVGGNAITITGNSITENVTGMSDIYIAAESEWNTQGVANVTVSNNSLIDGGPNQGSLTVYDSQGGAYSISGLIVSGNQFVMPKYVPVQFVGNGAEAATVQGNTAYLAGTRFFDDANSLASVNEAANQMLAPAAYQQPAVAAGGGCGFPGC
jgi:hypothetical protein